MRVRLVTTSYATLSWTTSSLALASLFMLGLEYYHDQTLSGLWTLCWSVDNIVLVDVIMQESVCCGLVPCCCAYFTVEIHWKRSQIKRPIKNGATLQLQLIYYWLDRTATVENWLQPQYASSNIHTSSHGRSVSSNTACQYRHQLLRRRRWPWVGQSAASWEWEVPRIDIYE